MMQAVSATYDGKNFVLDENLNLETGQKVIVMILKDEFDNTPKAKNDEEIHNWIKKYSDNAENIFQNTASVDEYLSKLRKERNLNLKDYMGIGEKMFKTTEDIDKHIKDLRSDDRF